MRTELDKRRGNAMGELGDAAKEIADKYRLCPVCLIIAVGNAIQHDLGTGGILHFTDRHSDAEKGVN